MACLAAQQLLMMQIAWPLLVQLRQLLKVEMHLCLQVSSRSSNLQRQVRPVSLHHASSNDHRLATFSRELKSRKCGHCSAVDVWMSAAQLRFREFGSSYRLFMLKYLFQKTVPQSCVWCLSELALARSVITDICPSSKRDSIF